MSNKIEIEIHDIINDSEIIEQLWKLYDEAYGPTNAETPFSQSFSRREFLSFMTNPRVRKVIALLKKEIVGLGLITDQLELDPVISCSFFRRYYSNIPIWYILGIAVKPFYRRQITIAKKILQNMINEVPVVGCGLFIHSIRANPLIPKFAKLVGRDYIEGEKIDEIAIWLFRWAKGQKPNWNL